MTRYRIVELDDDEVAELRAALAVYGAQTNYTPLGAALMKIAQNPPSVALSALCEIADGRAGDRAVDVAIAALTQLGYDPGTQADRLCAQPSPDGETTCARSAGHPGRHTDDGGEGWD